MIEATSAGVTIDSMALVGFEVNVIRRSIETKRTGNLLALRVDVNTDALAAMDYLQVNLLLCRDPEK